MLPTYILICGSGKALSVQEYFFPDTFALDLILDHSEVKSFFPVVLIVLFVFPVLYFWGFSPSKGYPEAFLPRVFSLLHALAVCQPCPLVTGIIFIIFRR